MRTSFAALVAFLPACAVQQVEQPLVRASTADIQLAATPPMGFNTWNKFGM